MFIFYITLHIFSLVLKCSASLPDDWTSKLIMVVLSLGLLFLGGMEYAMLRTFKAKHKFVLAERSRKKNSTFNAFGYGNTDDERTSSSESDGPPPITDDEFFSE